MWELSCALILTGRPTQQEIYRQSDPLERLLSCPVLEWPHMLRQDSIWDDLAVVCADSVTTVRFPENSKERTRIFEIVKQGVLYLRSALTDEDSTVQFGEQFIGMTLMELVQSSWRAGYIAERVLSYSLIDALSSEDNAAGKHGQAPKNLLFQADICTGLASILTQIGQADNNAAKKNLRELKKRFLLEDDVADVLHAIKEGVCRKGTKARSFDMKERSKCWLYSSNSTDVCDDPAVAIASIVDVAHELAQSVVDMFLAYDASKVRMTPTRHHSEDYWKDWLRFKFIQAKHGICGLHQNDDK